MTAMNAHKDFVEHGGTTDEKEFDGLSCFLCKGKALCFSYRNWSTLLKQKSLVLDNARESFRGSILDVQLELLKFCVLWPKCCVLAGGSGTHWV
jgi:hypothetical protein